MKEFISVFLFLVTFNAFSQSHLNFLQPQSKGSSYHIETVEKIKNQKVKGLNVRQEKKQKGLFEIKPIGYFEESLCSEIRIKNLNVEQTASNASQINPKSFEGLTAIIRSDSLFKFKRIYKQTETQWKEEVVFVDFLEKAIESIHGFSSAKMNESSNWIIASRLKESGSFWTEDSTFFQVIERKDTLSKSCFKTKWKRKFEPRDRSEDMFVPMEGFEMKAELEGTTFFDIQTGKLVFSEYEGIKTYFEINDPNIKSEYQVKTEIQLQEEDLPAIEENFQEYLKKWEQRKFISQPMLERKWHDKLKLLETNVGDCYLGAANIGYIILERRPEKFRIDSTGKVSKELDWAKHFYHPHLKLFKEEFTGRIGIKNEKNEIIHHPKFNHIESLSQKWIKVVKGRNDGLLDSEGTQVIPCEYNYISFHPSYNSFKSNFIKAELYTKGLVKNYRSFNLKSGKFIPDSLRIVYAIEGDFYVAYDTSKQSKNLYNIQNSALLSNPLNEVTKIFNHIYLIRLENQKQFLVSLEGNNFRKIVEAKKTFSLKGKRLAVTETSEGEVKIFDQSLNRIFHYPNYKLSDCTDDSCILQDKKGRFFIFNGKKKLKKISGFDEIFSSRHHFIGKKEDDSFWINNKGKILFNSKNELSISPDFFITEGGNKNFTSIINNKGKQISGVYDNIEWDDFSFPVLIIKEKKYGIFHPNKDLELPIEFERIGSSMHFFTSNIYNSNYWLLKKSKSEKGLFHKKYGVLIPPEFDTIKVTKNNLILVGQGNHFAILKLIE